MIQGSLLLDQLTEAWSGRACPRSRAGFTYTHDLKVTSLLLLLLPPKVYLIYGLVIEISESLWQAKGLVVALITNNNIFIVSANSGIGYPLTKG